MFFTSPIALREMLVDHFTANCASSAFVTIEQLSTKNQWTRWRAAAMIMMICTGRQLPPVGRLFFYFLLGSCMLARADVLHRAITSRFTVLFVFVRVCEFKNVCELDNLFVVVVYEEPWSCWSDHVVENIKQAFSCLVAPSGCLQTTDKDVPRPWILGWWPKSAQSRTHRRLFQTSGVQTTWHWSLSLD